MLSALTDFPGEDVSPSELLPRLRQVPAWVDYLGGFESERGQPAALGRFLVDLGLAKSGHHRTRGSLYAVAELRARLRELGAGEAAGGPPAEAEETGPRRRHSDEAAVSVVTGAGAAAAAAPARRTPVIGWRRRESDASRRRAQPPAVVAETQPERREAPQWVGSGQSVAMPGGPVTPYTPPAEYYANEDPGLPLAFYWTQVRRHLYKILLLAAVVTLATAFYSLRIPKRYESVATLRMDFRVPAIQADANNNPGFDPDTLIQTEVRDVTQRSVILDAIHSAHRDRDAHLAAELGGGGGSALPTAANPDARLDALVALIQGHTRPLQPENTHNIDVHFQSLDPDTSATVANAVAAALITHEFQTRQQEQNDQLRFMEQQFSDISARVEKEQAALTDYQHSHNILNLDNQGSLESSTVSTLNTAYLTAQAALTRYQAEESVLQSGQLTDALLASDDGQILRPAYQARQEAQRKFDEVKNTRGTANPEYQSAQDALRIAQQQLDQAVASARNQIHAQYLQARNQVTLVGRQLQDARGAMQQFNDKAIDFNQQKRDLEADQKLHDDLQAQIKQQQLTESISGSGLRITNRATPNPAPVYPNVRNNVVLALLFSLFGGCALAILAGYLDRSFTAPDAVEQYLRIPLLGALPVMSDRDNLIELAERPPAAPDGRPAPRSAFAEAILMLRTAVLYAAPPGLRTLSITSAQPQEGKSVAAANLAIALALHGAKVLLIDTDIRRPTLHRIFETGNSLGLTSVLRQQAALEDSFRATQVERLYLMPAGPAVANPSELLATLLGQVLAPLAAEFDYVILDSPPVLGFADALSVAIAVEGTLLVARAGKTPREIVHAALKPLQRVRARVLGLVLNQVSSSLSPYYSYYHDHYQRYAADADETSGEGLP
ncbi:MAG: GumC family protein [Terriglobales bacterium]